MALKNLRTEVMLELSGAWLDPQRDRTFLEADPLLSGLLPKLVEAHEQLLAAEHEKSESDWEQQLEQLQREETEKDAYHDRKIRGTWWVLCGLAELSDNQLTKKSLLELRDTLLPGGLASVLRSYAEEAGEAQALEQRLSETHWQLLKSINLLEEQSLEHHVRQWVQAGHALGELEERRKQLYQDRSLFQRPHLTQLQARDQWVRVVMALVHLIQVDEHQSRILDAQVIQPLALAEAKADGKHHVARPEIDDEEQED
jgi:hypothetical protein